MHSWTKSLKGILTISVVLAVTVPIVVMGFFTVQLLNHSLTYEITEKNQLVANSLASETNQLLFQASQVINQVAAEVDNLGLTNQAAIESYLITMISNFPCFDSVRIVSEQGIVILAIPTNSDYVGDNLADHDFYHQLQVSQQSGWSAVFISPVTGKPTIIFGHPLQQGMLIGNLNLGCLHGIVSQVDKLTSGWAGITDADGTYIGHTIQQQVDDQINVRELDFVQKGLQGEVGSYRYKRSDKEFMVNVAVVSVTGWPVIVAQDVNTALAPVYDTRNFLIAGVLIGLLLAVATALFLLEKILKPLVPAAASIKAVAAGDYQARKLVQSYTEFAVIAHDFAVMAQTVAYREQALKNKQQELELSMAEVERSNQELAQFAYVASHDLKAPLRAIANLSQWLEEDLAGCLNDSAREKMQLLRGRVQRMENLIAGILEYSRIGKGQRKLEAVDTNEMLMEISEYSEELLEFTINIGQGMPVLQADRVQLYQVFANLIGNAVKHHDRLQGVIEITVREQAGFYEFSVVDDGPGIDASLHEKVFEIFQTLKARDQFESTGVGLAVVKKIVEQQGGTIHLISQVGQGAQFIFTWPK